jgi:poly(3-hydroxybutyrate) depolymerase
MRKIFTSLLILSLALSLCGCGEKESPPQPGMDADNTIEATTDTTEETGEKPDASDIATDSAAESVTEERVIMELEDITSNKENVFTCSYDGVKHDFVISLPQESKNAPLIVMLHGAGDSAENFRRTSGFDDDALPKGYAVCYAAGTVNAKAGRNYKSWNYGRFETDYDDVGFIKALVKYLVEEYSLDGNHVFCAGFSNGGFMNFRLALEAQDTFLACASVGGDLCKTLWDKRPETNDVGMLTVIGEIDESVPKNFDGTAKTTLDPAIEDVVDYMASSNGLELQSEGEIGDGSIICKYGADSDKDIVWYVVVNDAKHGWPTEELNSISVNKLILEFFDNWR